MRTGITLLVAVLLLGGCTGTEQKAEATPPPVAAAAKPQDAAAQKAAEQQAAMEARANAAREIAKAQQAQRELAAQDAAAQLQAEKDAKANEQAAAQAAAAAQATQQAALDKVAAEAAQKAAADKAAADKAAAAAVAAGKAAPAANKDTAVTNPYDLNVVAEVQTTAGTMVLGFYPDVAPGHVKNFVDLARKGFYDGTRFHRTIPGFMIQGGDPLTKDLSKQNMWGSGDPGYKIKGEFNDKLHERGTLSMARSQSPDSAGSQFFICHARAPGLDKQYTVFGELLTGYDVLDKIATAPAGPQSNGEKSRPLDPVQIVKVIIRARTAADVKKDS